MKSVTILMYLTLIGASPALCAATPPEVDTGGDTFTFTPISGTIPAHDAYIEHFHTGVTPFASNGQTGDLFIRYSDDTNIRAWEAPDKKVIMPAMGTPEDDEQIGVDEIEIGKDRRTIAWAEIGAPCCESYPLPLSIGVYQSGEWVLHIAGPGILDYWTYLDKGRRIIAVWGPAHGPQVLDYQIIDLKTHQVTAEVFSNWKTQALDARAPAWALRAQAAINRR